MKEKYKEIKRIESLKKRRNSENGKKKQNVKVRMTQKGKNSKKEKKDRQKQSLRNEGVTMLKHRMTATNNKEIKAEQRNGQIV